jgi:hypothetical protein
MENLARFAISIGVAALFAGCARSQLPVGAPGAMSQSRSPAVRYDHQGSWMAPGARKDDLLYITNADDNVTVYSYPKGRLVGTLDGFYNAQAECVDKAGDVFISSNNDTVTEYRHAGTKPIRTLTFPGYFAGGCASDPKTGNLAVAWIENFYGYVGVYTDATGSPKLYESPNMLLAYCAYDDAGNLFVDGFAYASGLLQLAELPKNGNRLETIKLNETIFAAGPVQWDGKYLAVGDNETEKIYQFLIAGKSGNRQGTTSLGGAQNISQWWIEKDKVIGSSRQSPYVTWYWKYPAGGSPTKTLSLKGVDAPYAAVVSKAKK